MFNLFKSGKQIKIEGIKKQILIWYEACRLGVDVNLLKEPRPQVGAILFFIGGIDNLCQANQIDDKTFASLGLGILDSMGFRREISSPVIFNFYQKRPENEFALSANLEGGKKLAEFLSGENNMAPLAFGAFVREWSEDPDLKPEDMTLLL